MSKPSRPVALSPMHYSSELTNTAWKMAQDSAKRDWAEVAWLKQYATNAMFTRMGNGKNGQDWCGRRTGFHARVLARGTCAGVHDPVRRLANILALTLPCS